MSAASISALIPKESSASSQSRQDLEARLNGLGGLNGRKLDPQAKAKKLREACEGFESIFIQKMWQEMRNTLPKDGLLHGKEERFWQDMYDQELAKSMTSAGGIGLADMMYEQLSRNLVSASRGTARQNPLMPMSKTAAFAPEAYSLLGKAQDGENPLAADAAESKIPPKAQAKTQVADLSVYDPVPVQQKAETKASESGTASTDGETQENPEIAKALAAVRAQQALHRQAEAESGAIPVQTANNRPGPIQPARHNPTGLELAQMAKREAGDKLGPRSVRPPLHQARADQSQAVASPATSALGENEQADLKTRKIRYSTNVPPNERARRGLKPIRMLNVDNVSQASKAGVGLAAYHEAQSAAKGAESVSPPSPKPSEASLAAQALAAEALNPGQGIAPLTSQDLGKTEGAAFTIPPLTAADLRG